MDDKEKYNAALERAREIHRNEDEKRFDMEWIFPELKEDNDERIREELISLVKYTKGLKIGYKLRITQDEMIAWIEKQGEQKSADKTEPKFKVGDWG